MPRGRKMLINIKSYNQGVSEWVQTLYWENITYKTTKCTDKKKKKKAVHRADLYIL